MSAKYVIGVLGTFVVVAGVMGCLQDTSDNAKTSPVVAPLSTLGIDRYIPIRIVRFGDHTATEKLAEEADARKWIEFANNAFRAAGIQFYLRAINFSTDPAFTRMDPAPGATIGDPPMPDPTGKTYVWPSPPGSSGALVYRPDCPIVLPANGVDAKEFDALQRASAYCSFDDEALVYWLPESHEAADLGNVPEDARSVYVFGGIGALVMLTHELGHFLGARAHVGGSEATCCAGWDPILPTGQANLWDMHYLPAAATGGTTNTYFSSREAIAALTPSLFAQLKAIPGGHICASPGQPGACDSRPAGTMRFDIDTGLGTVETWYSGDYRVRGLSMQVPGGPSAVNAMDLSYTNPEGIALPVMFGDSQIAAFRRYLRHDVDAEFGLKGRRPRLGRSVATPWNPSINLDGQGGRDLVVFNPSAGSFTVRPSGADNSYGEWGTFSVTLGMPGVGGGPARDGDIPMLEDFDGDGKTDYAVLTGAVDASDPGYFVLRWCPSSVTVNQGTNKCARVENISWGIRGDIITPGVNFDGDASTPEVAAYRPSTSDWFWAKLTKPSASAPAGEATTTYVAGSIQQIQYPGGPAAEPLYEDYDGDGRTDIALFDPPSATFAMRLSSDLGTMRVATFPAPPNSATLPAAIRGMRNELGRPAFAAYYPGGGTGSVATVRVLFRPLDVAQVWTYQDPDSNGSGVAYTRSAGQGLPDVGRPVSGHIDTDANGISDVLVYELAQSGGQGRVLANRVERRCKPGVQFCSSASNVYLPTSTSVESIWMGFHQGELSLNVFVVGDMTGDGLNEVVDFHPYTHMWNVHRSNAPAYQQVMLSFVFGAQGEQPL